MCVNVDGGGGNQPNKRRAHPLSIPCGSLGKHRVVYGPRFHRNHPITGFPLSSLSVCSLYILFGVCVCVIGLLLFVSAVKSATPTFYLLFLGRCASSSSSFSTWATQTEPSQKPTKHTICGAACDKRSHILLRDHHDYYGPTKTLPTLCFGRVPHSCASVFRLWLGSARRDPGREREQNAWPRESTPVSFLYRENKFYSRRRWNARRETAFALTPLLLLVHPPALISVTFRASKAHTVLRLCFKVFCLHLVWVWIFFICVFVFYVYMFSSQMVPDLIRNFVCVQKCIFVRLLDFVLAFLNCFFFLLLLIVYRNKKST